MIAALTRRAVLLGVAVVCVLAMLPAQRRPPPSPALVPAADTSAFRPGNIIADAVFYDAGAMSAAQVQAFLTQQGANCAPASGGPACLKDYRMTTPTPAADAYCPRTPGPRTRRPPRSSPRSPPPAGSIRGSCW